MRRHRQGEKESLARSIGSIVTSNQWFMRLALPYSESGFDAAVRLWETTLRLDAI
ncbi:MAG: hypothetical protein U0941_08605 [Planctomycetaceae bacterium]